MRITKEDVGHKVRLRNGSVIEIISFKGDLEWPVEGSDGLSWKVDGIWSPRCVASSYDIVEFVDDKKSIVEKLENYITEYYNCASPDQQAMLREISEDILRKNIVKSCKLVDIE